MTAPNTAPQGYSAPQIALHWAVAVLVAGQYIFKDAISGTWDAIRAGETYAFDPLILTHVAGGALILAFVVWHLVLRLTRGVPAAPENEPAPLKTLSHIAHWAFYAVLAAMPALVAIRFNPDLKAKYRNLREAGKPAKVAIVAVMRKPIETANALGKADRKWPPKIA